MENVFYLHWNRKEETMENRTRLFLLFISILCLASAFIPGQFDALQNISIFIGTFCWSGFIFSFKRRKLYTTSESGKHSVTITHSQKGYIVKIEIVEFDNGNKVEWHDEKKGGANE